MGKAGEMLDSSLLSLPFQNNDLVSQRSPLGLTSVSLFTPAKNRVLMSFV